MSFYRENVTWQSENGSWSRGFFSNFQVGDDPEWDVEYDFNRFEWVSTGHPSEYDADSSWPGPNPGGGETIPFSEATAADCRRYDAMAAECPQ